MAIHKHPSLHHGAHAARRQAASIQHMFHKGSGTPPPSVSGMGVGGPGSAPMPVSDGAEDDMPAGLPPSSMTPPPEGM